MFRLHSLKIYDHPFLGTINNGLAFIPKNETNLTREPYTTIIIGQNGTGKSSIIGLIVLIFEELKKLKEKKTYSAKIKFKYEITYQINSDVFIVAYNFKINPETKRKVDNYTLIKNREAFTRTNEIALPSKIIAVSYLATDRFRAKKNDPDDFYIYLGLRDTSNTARSKSFLNNTLPMLFDFIKDKSSFAFLKSILKFLGLNTDYFGISFEYRYKKAFFTGELTRQEFIGLFETYSSFSGRTDTPFGVKYFDIHIRDNSKLITRLVNFINIRSFQDSVREGKKSYLEFNLLKDNDHLDDLELISHLRRLDLISSASFMFKKGVQSPFDANEASSGEFHFLTTMIAIQSSIRNNSLILIDEPEISLHPNWQMKYIHYLKELFQNWSNCHFLMTTHSHFLVTDLKDDSSEIVGLKGTAGHLQAKSLDQNTYGWSAEQVLLEVFNTVTSRNFYLADLIGQTLELMSHKSLATDKKEILNKNLNDLKTLHLDLKDSDPLKLVIKKILE